MLAYQGNEVRTTGERIVKCELDLVGVRWLLDAVATMGESPTTRLIAF